MRTPSIPPRVFGFVVTLVVVTLFSAFNLNHRSSVSFGFHTIEDVPVFITCLTSFTLGAVVMVPLVVRRRPRAANIDAQTQHDKQAAEPPEEGDERAPALPPPPGDDAETENTVPSDQPRRAWWRPWGKRRGDREA
ncbi:MAG: hypothetical protein OXH96_08315 [Spirochaetaceae bacterium]|nr:hypothetical protein [Spirochaetaceae bacterium]